MNKLSALLRKRKRPELIFLDELDRVHDVVADEMMVFESPLISSNEKSQRLLYLFVRDLLDDTQGNILNFKNSRDNNDTKLLISKDTKLLISILITFGVTGMLFYIYLFILRQTRERQQAWIRSFVVWTLFDIFLVSTCTAFLPP